MRLRLHVRWILRLLLVSPGSLQIQKNLARQIRMSLRLSGISRPQKRDQTEKYNEKYFGLFEKFWFFKVEFFSKHFFNNFGQFLKDLKGKFLKFWDFWDFGFWKIWKSSRKFFELIKKIEIFNFVNYFFSKSFRCYFFPDVTWWTTSNTWDGFWGWCWIFTDSKKNLARQNEKFD